MERSRPKSLLSDVARMARVSTATASRALSVPDMVLPETRIRVQKAVEMLGYVPHGAARALVTRRSRTIAAVIPTLDNPIFASSVQAMQLRLAVDGFTLLLGSHEYDLSAEARVVAALIERGVDGIVLVGLDHDAAVYNLLDSTRLPYELTWTLDPAGIHHCLGFSNRAAAAEVALHLVGLGHREIAMVSGHIGSNDRARERVAGVRETLQAHGLFLAPSLMIETGFSVRNGRDALSALLASGKRFTAVLCGNDILAMGVLAEAARRMISVPKQLSVTGFDDIDLAREWQPTLTTMRLPVAEIGRRAAERMLARLEGDAISRIEQINVSLIVRESSARCPTGT